MIVEGKIIFSLIEMVSKKFVSIVGDKATKYLDQDETRNGAYKLLKLLKLAEQEFVMFECDMRAIARYGDSYFATAISRRILRLNEILVEMRSLFEALGIKIEVFLSREDVDRLEYYLAYDGSIVELIMGADFQKNDMDFKNFLENAAVKMAAESSKARLIIAKFIKENYKADQRVDGR